MRTHKTKNRQWVGAKERESQDANSHPVYYMHSYTRDQNEDEDNEEVRFGIDPSISFGAEDKRNTGRSQSR